MAITQAIVDEMLKIGEGAVHNAILVRASTAPGINAEFEVDGTRLVAPSHPDLGGDVGKIGYFRIIDPRDLTRPVTAAFRPYADQSLRRRPEYDGSEYSRNPPGYLGWSCNAKGMFHAPAGIIPGETGSYVPDRTTPLTIEIPPEFEDVCRSVRCTPKQVLRGFIADAAGILNFFANPRVDRYSSNGSDERLMAEEYIDRAWGHNREDAAHDQAMREEAAAYEKDWEETISDIQQLAEDHGLESHEITEIVETHLKNQPRPDDTRTEDQED